MGDLMMVGVMVGLVAATLGLIALVDRLMVEEKAKPSSQNEVR